MHIDLLAHAKSVPNIAPGRVALSGCAGAVRGGAHVYQMTLVCTMQPVFPTWPKSVGGVGEKSSVPAFFALGPARTNNVNVGALCFPSILGLSA